MELHQASAKSPDFRKRMYTVVEVIELAKVSLRKVRLWTERGLLVPMYIATGAEGNRPTYYYSESQVMKAVIILEMRRRKLPLKAIEIVDRKLKKRGLRLEESGNYLLTNGQTVCLANDPGEAVDLLKHRGQMLLIAIYEPLLEIQKQLQSRMTG